MELYRLGVKFFAADPASVSLPDFIPIFHTWIQRQIVDGHLLIDVHNYSHIHNGPGILLVAHEGNFSIDMAEGRPGLLYYRKQPGADFAAAVQSALRACRLLEEEPVLKGRLQFRNDELLIIANDRLHAPNNEQTFSELKPLLSSALRQSLGRSDLTLTRASTNPKDRFAVTVSRAL